MIPTQIRLSENEQTKTAQISLLWDDGHKGFISLQSLRDNCPCAGCKGETVLLKTYTPTAQPEMPGKYKLINAQQVGSYALGISWGDGHNTGIYTWEKLREICECDICLGKKQ